jgi:hypothetical protein
MGALEGKGKHVTYWWVGVLLVCLAAGLTPIACRFDPKAALAPIPLGSKLSDLSEYLNLSYDSDVQEWLAAPTADTTGHRTTKFGSFFIRELGNFDGWRASRTTRDAFTGEIRLYHYSRIVPDDLAPSYVFVLVYVRGALMEKGYGQLPG